MPTSRKPQRATRPTSRSVISNQLRAILSNGEHSLFAVARDSGVALSCLSRFVSGERSLQLGSLDQLADILGLKLVETGRTKVKPSRSPRPASSRGHRDGAQANDLCASDNDATLRTPADAHEQAG